MRKYAGSRPWMHAAGAALTLWACASNQHPTAGPGPRSQVQSQLAGMEPAKFLLATDAQRTLDGKIDSWFQRSATRRAYIMVDKPLYQPGETIWFRADVRQAASLTPMPGQFGVTMQLLSPKGAMVAQKRVLVAEGIAANDFEIPPDAQGGEYTIQLTGDEGTQDKRTVVIASYEAPRLKKTLEFLRKAYGPGDKVAAAVEVARGTGEPFADKTLTALVTIDDVEVARQPVKTDATGKAVVHFTLPATIARGDGLLTLLADDGGVTESIQRRIPIVLKTLDLSLYPEGGDLVQGLPGRVYFSALNTLGKPADVEGKVVDDAGRTVATFASVHDGLGRFDLTPEDGRSYHVQITRPVGIVASYDVPAAKKEGCSLQSLDDFDTKSETVKVAAWCTQPRTILAEAVLREKRLASGSVDIPSGKPSVIALPVDPALQGAVRVTIFSDKHEPLAERLVYRGRGRDLKVTITADRKHYAPRDRVVLSVHTSDLAGKPVSASLGLAVADDTVLSYADDKSGHLVAHLYLEKELGDVTLEEPDFYFSDKPEAAAALDLVMGTKGWRRFEWQLVMNPPPPVQYEVMTAGAMGVPDMEPPMPAPPANMAPPEEKPQAVVPPAGKKAGGPKGGGEVAAVVAPAQPVQPEKPVVMHERMNGEAAKRKANADDLRAKDEEWDGVAQAQIQQWNFVPTRQFPAPQYEPGYAGPRTDFRQTIFWAPDIRTGQDGNAKVSFYMSDAVTSFRATAEGVSAGGLPGEGQAVLQSKMPLSLDARLPLEVSSGDHVELPVTLTNETDRAMDADLHIDAGKAFKSKYQLDRKLHIEAHGKQALFFGLDVVGNGKVAADGDLAVSVATAGLTDELHKTVKVSPLGFPFEVSFSGSAKGSKKHVVDLSGALPGTITASVQMYPSPLASMTSGTDAILREPGGCFEQTSSSNYPNTMVLQYLESNDAADPAIVEKASGMMDRGYKILTGYETKERGYEWFGETPGHEALTAYGIMEFEDMAQVDDHVDRAMIDRTAEWLMKRRDGKGGYQRNERALDSFGRASYETTNAYITWALSEAHHAKGLDKELAASKQAGLESKDPYVVALAANTMLNTAKGADETRAIVKRLAGMQGQDGGFAGAKESITMSGGDSLAVETTAIAVLALTKASDDGAYEQELRAGVEWLNGKRDGWGSFASTQGTVLSLKALAAYTEHSRQTQSSGVATVLVNGKPAGKIAFEKGRKEALVFDDIAGAMVAGPNTIEIKVDSENPLPYSVAVTYRAQKPQSSPDAKVAVTTELAKKEVKLGEGVKLTAHVVNKTQGGVPMTLARVGLPGGLTFQTWQLKELRDKKLIDFYETREREVILYWRALPPGAKKDVSLDLMATLPGTYVAPASSGYLYYTDEDRSWAAPLSIAVTK